MELLIDTPVYQQPNPFPCCIQGECDDLKRKVKSGLRHFRTLDNSNLLGLLQLIKKNIEDESFVEFLVQTPFLKHIDYLVNEKGKENEEVIRITCVILTQSLRNPYFRRDVIEYNVASTIIKAYHKNISTMTYLCMSEFIRTLVKTNEVKNQDHLNEMKEFFVEAICNKKITIILDSLEWYIRLTNGQYFDMTPSNKFLRRINHLHKYRYRNEQLQFLMSRLSIFFD